MVLTGRKWHYIYKSAKMAHSAVPVVFDHSCNDHSVHGDARKMEPFLFFSARGLYHLPAPSDVVVIRAATHYFVASRHQAEMYVDGMCVVESNATLTGLHRHAQPPLTINLRPPKAKAKSVSCAIAM